MGDSGGEWGECGRVWESVVECGRVGKSQGEWERVRESGG